MTTEGRSREAEQTSRIVQEAEAKVAKLSDKDDIKAYLSMFERLMSAYNVSKQRWVYKLAPQLSGKAQQAYTMLSSDEAKEYDQVNDVILRRYDISEETYKQQFRTAMKSTDESNRELAVRVKDLAVKWLKQHTTVDDIIHCRGNLSRTATQHLTCKCLGLGATMYGGVKRDNGKLVHDIILDTGASKTIIRKELVPKGKMLDKCAEIKCAHGD